jgi:hypothetical protein
MPQPLGELANLTDEDRNALFSYSPDMEGEA